MKPKLIQFVNGQWIDALAVRSVEALGTDAAQYSHLCPRVAVTLCHPDQKHEALVMSHWCDTYAEAVAARDAFVKKVNRALSED